MARLPPSRPLLNCGLRIPDLRARDDAPLNRSCHQGVPAICLMRRLPAQSIRRCGLNATFRTRLQRYDGDWWPLSPRCYRVAHAAPLGTDTEICDTVRLGRSEQSNTRPSPLRTWNVIGPQPVDTHCEQDSCRYNEVAGEFFGYEELEH